MICAHAYMWRKNGVVKEAIVLQWMVWMASWDFKPGKSNGLVHCSVKNAVVLCENHRERVMQIWTSPSEEEEEEERKTFWLAVWRLSGSVLSRCFLPPLGVFFVMKTLEDEWQGVITAYKLALLEILRIFRISIYCMSALSLHIESTDSMMLLCARHTLCRCTFLV